MIFIRPARRGSRRHLVLRVGLFFLAAGLWLAGVMVGNPTVTASAIVIAAAAILLGLAARRRTLRQEEAGEDG